MTRHAQYKVQKGATRTDTFNSQAVSKPLAPYQINLKLASDCHQSLVKHNGIQLIWVPGHRGIEGNETSDQQARLGSKFLFTGPQPASQVGLPRSTSVTRQ
jgi:ribonuclease HI